MPVSCDRKTDSLLLQAYYMVKLWDFYMDGCLIFVIHIQAVKKNCYKEPVALGNCIMNIFKAVRYCCYPKAFIMAMDVCYRLKR